MNEVTRCPKQFIILSDDCLVLKEFHTIGTWTGLVVTLVISKFDLSGDYYDLINNNIKIVKKGYMPNFTVTTFFQQRYLYEVIFACIHESNENYSNTRLFEEKLDNKIKCLTSIRTCFDYSAYKKHRFISSNEKCIFYPHLGGNDITLNKKFNVILNRTYPLRELGNYKALLDNIENYVSENKEVLMIDSLKNLEYFVFRDLMIEILRKFSTLESVHRLNEKYKVNLAFPISICVSLKVLLNYKECISYLNQNAIELPIIIKFQSTNEEIRHQMIVIISQNGLRNVHEFVEKFDLESTSCIIQKYSNHGGKVLKLYRYNNKANTFLRPSLPDFFAEFEQKHEEFSRGYFNFKTRDLLGDKLINFWKKYDQPLNIQKLINEKYLEELSAIFEELVGKTLFGLDFVYDYKNNIYLIIDCNNFPGYKEIEKTFNKEISEHIIFYLSSHLKKR